LLFVPQALALGYLSFTKKGDRILIVVKHQRYVADLKGVKAVLDGKQAYTLIYEVPTEVKPTQSK
jgi:hypothetical protein